MSYLRDHFNHVAALALAHLALVLVTLVIAMAIAFPIGIWAARRGGRGSTLALGVLGAIYTIPSLALLAIFVQLFGLGVTPIVVALIAYAQFMLVRNISAGLRGVDPAIRDAGTGLGMSANELLFKVELPLALPVIVGGIRIAAVAMVAIATLGGYVGAGGLGTLIFTGLTLHHNDEIVAGSIAAAALAIGVDLAFRLIERASATSSAGGR